MYTVVWRQWNYLDKLELSNYVWDVHMVWNV